MATALPQYIKGILILQITAWALHMPFFNVYHFKLQHDAYFSFMKELFHRRKGLQQRNIFFSLFETIAETKIQIYEKKMLNHIRES